MELNECVQHMGKWFLSDTIELLEQVLADDEKDPKYSAITTLNRLYIYMEFKKRTDKFDCDNIQTLFTRIGYSKNAYELFRLMAEKEYPMYSSEIYDKSFFNE